MSDDARFAWAVVVPVKVLARAKSRIAPLAGSRRAELALAMAMDTISAVVASPAAGRVIVVTDDPVAAAGLSAVGATVVPDEPGAGLNEALVHGASRAARWWPGSGIAALSGDLPALRPEELAEALQAASSWPEAFVPDVQGSGTTLYTAGPGVTFRPGSPACGGTWTRGRTCGRRPGSGSGPARPPWRRNCCGRQADATRARGRRRPQTSDVDDGAGEGAGDARDRLDAGGDQPAQLVHVARFGPDDDVVRPGHVLGRGHPGDLPDLLGDVGGLAYLSLDQDVGLNHDVLHWAQ
jgi:2-phospho-L-lactate guanylyltransferase